MSHVQSRDYSYESGSTTTCTYYKVTGIYQDADFSANNASYKTAYDTCVALKKRNGYRIVTTSTAKYPGTFRSAGQTRTATLTTTKLTKSARIFGSAEKDEIISRVWNMYKSGIKGDVSVLYDEYSVKAKKYLARIIRSEYTTRKWATHYNAVGGIAVGIIQKSNRNIVTTNNQLRTEWSEQELEGIWNGIKNEINVSSVIRTAYNNGIDVKIETEIAKLIGESKRSNTVPSVTRKLRDVANDYATALLADESWTSRKLSDLREEVYRDADTSIGTYARQIKREYNSETDLWVRLRQRYTKVDLSEDDAREHFEDELEDILIKYRIIVRDEDAAKVAADKVIADAAAVDTAEQDAIDVLNQHLVDNVGDVTPKNQQSSVNTLANYPPTHYSYKIIDGHHRAYSKSLLAALDPVISSTPDDGLPIVDTVTPTDTTRPHIPRRGKNESIVDYKARVLALIEANKDSATAFTGGDGTATPVTTLDDYLPFYAEITKIANYLSGESTSSVNETELGNRYYRDIVARARAEKKFVDAMKDGTLTL